jgi:teichuronic acid biosynthesis glycosyltransferase TuaC
MRVLFIASGNNKNDIVSPIVLNQAHSLERKGLIVDIFPVNGQGVSGYIKNIRRLKKHLKNSKTDVVHAHYQHSGYLASLAGTKTLVVSLMGSEITPEKNLAFLRFFSKQIWHETIVKTKQMQELLSLEGTHVIPNGVNLSIFKPKDKTEALAKLQWDKSCKHLLFASSRFRAEKNFALTQKAVDIINREDIKLHTVENISNDLMPVYYNAADIVILTSHREGSPNVIKEAMACNRPIIATDVGDIKNVIASTKNCFVCDFDADQIAEKINYLLENNIQSTNGRENIQHLSDEVIADKIIAIYKKMLKQV